MDRGSCAERPPAKKRAPGGGARVVPVRLRGRVHVPVAGAVPPLPRPVAVRSRSKRVGAAAQPRRPVRAQRPQDGRAPQGQEPVTFRRVLRHRERDPVLQRRLGARAGDDDLEAPRRRRRRQRDPSGWSQSAERLARRRARRRSVRVRRVLQVRGRRFRRGRGRGEGRDAQRPVAPRFENLALGKAKEKRSRAGAEGGGHLLRAPR
mmetsp:Transcript_12479/g.52305  ORF Transcript_12479/g.52305 Transcript_12479/m.52305 type:complete len:206 (+) Transcript_12479:573-1190(+)